MAAKETDVNYDRFIERYASTVVHELDALEPAQLQEVLTHAIDSILDVEAFNYEIDEEKKDSVWLTAVRVEQRGSIKEPSPSSNRTCGFPAYGFREEFLHEAFTTESVRVDEGTGKG